MEDGELLGCYGLKVFFRTTDNDALLRKSIIFLRMKDILRHDSPHYFTDAS